MPNSGLNSAISYDTHSNIRSDYGIVNPSMRVGCPSGHEKIHVAPDDITGCSMQAASFGNVREEPLADIVSRMRSFRHFAKKSSRCIIAGVIGHLPHQP